MISVALAPEQLHADDAGVEVQAALRILDPVPVRMRKSKT